MSPKDFITQKIWINNSRVLQISKTELSFVKNLTTVILTAECQNELFEMEIWNLPYLLIQFLWVKKSSGDIRGNYKLKSYWRLNIQLSTELKNIEKYKMGPQPWDPWYYSDIS
jgi:hypothetical protein